MFRSVIILIFLGATFDVHSQEKSPVNPSSTVNPSPTVNTSFTPGKSWYDDKGEIINAHGGGILYANKKYYWYGEKRGRRQQEGVNVYSSTDLYNWKFEGLALSTVADTTSEIATGCLMERPKVIYNPKTRKYVMWFHLELRGQGYKAARAGVAVSENPVGPFNFVSSFRPNGNMSRDMNLFVDGDGSAYHIYSSRENYDLRISKLSDDFLTATTKDSMLFSKHREAPALFKSGKTYFLITSAATGWVPNKATLHSAPSLFGPWTVSEKNPMRGPNADSTFGGQSNFVITLPGRKKRFIFLADKWNPRDLKDSRYLWLPIKFEDQLPYVEWKDKWRLKDF